MEKFVFFWETKYDFPFLQTLLAADERTYDSQIHAKFFVVLLFEERGFKWVEIKFNFQFFK